MNSPSLRPTWVSTTGQHPLCQHHGPILSLCFAITPWRNQSVISTRPTTLGPFLYWRHNAVPLLELIHILDLGWPWHNHPLCFYHLHITTPVSCMVPPRTHFPEKKVSDKCPNVNRMLWTHHASIINQKGACKVMRETLRFNTSYGLARSGCYLLGLWDLLCPATYVVSEYGIISPTAKKPV